MRRLAAVDEAAAALGLHAGQKAADAAALTPDLVTAEADPAADAQALAALGDWCQRFSPSVAADPPDGLILDITGAAHLWGGEQAMAADLVRRLAANGIPALAAVAATPGAAWALSRHAACEAEAPVVSEPGEDARRLAPLPVAALRLDPGIAAQITRLGLSTIGRLAALPRDQVTLRFGPAVVGRLDQALGRAPEAVAFSRPPVPWFARLALVEPISAPEDLARVARDLAAQLCARLEAEGRGARRFEIAFHRLDGDVRRLSIGLSRPGRDPARVARLIEPLLDRVDPGFGIEVATLMAGEVERMSPGQASLDEDPRAAAQGDLAALVDRLTNRLGEAAVWRADPQPSHAPERAVVRRPPLSPTAGDGWDPERPRPMRLFKRPEPIEAIALAPDDPPVMFRWRGRAHRVRLSEGPERLAAEWWRAPFETAGDPEATRDYYQVEDEAGSRFWLFRAGLYGSGPPPRWWLHGLLA